MTSGERMVWAAEFVRRLALGQRAAESAYGAACAVDCLRRAGDAGTLDDDTRLMLDDMLSMGSDR